MTDISTRTLDTLDIVTVVVYVALLIGATWAFRRIKSFSEFALAGRKLAYPLIAMSLAATYIGPGFSMGAVGKGYAHGFLDFFIFLPFCLQTVLVGIFIAPRLSKYENCSTIGDVMRTESGVPAQLVAGFFSVVTCILFSAFLSKVAGQALSEIFGIPFVWALILVTTITAIYTTMGGFGADVLTDVVQMIVMVLVVPMLLIIVVNQPEFNLHQSWAMAVEHTETAYSGLGIGAVLAAGVSFLLGETLIPPYAQRALAVPTPPKARNAFLMAGLFGVVWLAIVTAIGIAANSFSLPNSDSDHILLALGAKVLPAGLWGLMLSAIASILMSSHDSVLNSGAVTLVRDLLTPLKIVNDRTEITWARGATILIAMIGAAVAGWLPDIINSLLFIYSLWAPSVLVPLILTLVVRNSTRHATWVSMIAGALTSGTWNLIDPLKSLIWPIVPGLVMATLVFAVAYLSSNRANATS